MPSVNNYAAVSMSQLKNIAKPFYDQLIALGRCPGYPWSYAPPGPIDDNAAANIGQAKNLFRFSTTDLTDADKDGIPDWFEAALSQLDMDGSGVPDAVEAARGTNPGGAKDPNSDTDGDGLTNAEEFAARTRYMGAGSDDSDGDGVPDGLDGWPTNPDLHPPRVPLTKFAVLPLSAAEIPPGATVTPQLGDGCQILYYTAGNPRYSLWSPASTKVVPLDVQDYPNEQMGQSIRMNPKGRKVAGCHKRDPEWGAESDAAIWDSLTGELTLLPTMAFGEVPSPVEGATCVNDFGAAAGRSYQQIPENNHDYLSGVLWNGNAAQQLGVLRRNGIFINGTTTFVPTAISPNGIVVGWEVPADRSTISGVSVSISGAMPVALDGGLWPAINSLDNPWIVCGNLWTRVGNVWKRQTIATWGKDDPDSIAEGSVWGINDRCEMIGGFWHGPGGKTGNLVRNGQVYDVNDLISGYTVETNGLMAINNRGIILTYVTPNGTGAAVLALLVPVELRKPRVDFQMGEHGLRSAQGINIATWEKAYVGGVLQDQFVENDPDRFYVRVAKVGTGADLLLPDISIATSGPDVEYCDAPTLCEVEEDPDDHNYWRSKAHILVSDTGDDDFKGKGVGLDGAPSDRTHIAQLGSVLRIGVVYEGTTGNVEWPVPEVQIKRVKVIAVIMRDKAPAHPDLEPIGTPATTPEAVRMDFRRANERFAQAGLILEFDTVAAGIHLYPAEIKVVNPPPNGRARYIDPTSHLWTENLSYPINLQDGLRLNPNPVAVLNRNIAEGSALDDAMSAQSSFEHEVWVYYVNYFAELPDTTLDGLTIYITGNPRIPSVNFDHIPTGPRIFMNSRTKEELTLAHEFGHALSKFSGKVNSDGHTTYYDPYNFPQNVMIAHPEYNMNQVEYGKRFTKAQITTIRSDPNAR